MNARARTCRRHRRALEAFVDRGERGPGTPAALEHLAICTRCEQELTETALMIAAMRRAGRELRAAPVPAITPARVVALARPRRRDPWSFRLQLGGLLTGAAIAAVVVLPNAGSTRPIGDSLIPARPAVTAVWRAAESRLAVAPDVPSFAAPSALPPRYPEGLSRPWKEVFPTDAIPREFEPR